MWLHVVVNFLFLWITYVNSNQCNEGCEICLGDKRCGRCERGFFLKINIYAAECFKCPSNCTACSRYEDCESCKPTFYGQMCEHSCSLCKNNACSRYGCVNGCKSGYYLDQNQYDFCKECSYRCTERTRKYVCSSCKNGWFGDGCRSSCIPCSQCVSRSCQYDCREYQDYRCANDNSRCHDKCSVDFSVPRRDEIVSSTTQQTTTRTTTPTPTRPTTHTTTRTTTPSPTRPTTHTTTRTTTPSPTRPTTHTTTRTTTPTPTRPTTHTTTRTTTPSPTRPTTHTTTRTTTPSPTRPTTHTTTRTITPTTIQTTPRLVTRAITPRPSTHVTSQIFASPQPTTPQQTITQPTTAREHEKDIETTAQPVILTESDQTSQTDGSDSPTLYIVIAVIGLLVLVGVIVVVVYLKRRKRTNCQDQVAYSPDTQAESHRLTDNALETSAVSNRDNAIHNESDINVADSDTEYVNTNTTTYMNIVDNVPMNADQIETVNTYEALSQYTNVKDENEYTAFNITLNADPIETVNTYEALSQYSNVKETENAYTALSGNENVYHTIPD